MCTKYILTGLPIREIASIATEYYLNMMHLSAFYGSDPANKDEAIRELLSHDHIANFLSQRENNACEAEPDQLDSI